MRSAAICVAALLVCAAASRLNGAQLRSARLRGLGDTSDSELLRLHPYYHSSATISERLRKLASTCPSLFLHQVNGTGWGETVPIEVVTIRAHGAKPVNKNFLLFGEHARELISPESGLHLAEALCGGHGLGKRARDVLKRSEFQMVINANPRSRRKVEQGEFCLRMNPNGVDLNRNWDEKWVNPDGITSSGPSPFSEAETKAVRGLVERYNPTNFVTVHSGTKGLYMPWAYDMEHLATRNRRKMMSILKELDGKYCKCPFGAAGKEVGYSCPGTSIDWVYDKLNTPYAFAWEIWADPSDEKSLATRWQEKVSSSEGSFLQEHSSLAHEHFRDLFQKHPSSFVQLRSENAQDGEDHDQCFGQFNPDTEELYKKTLDNWSRAFLDLADLVAKEL